MRRLALAAGLATACVASGPAKAVAQAVVGQPAPAFTLIDCNGGARSLVDFAGRTVVLEWWNHECPFVDRHYGSGNMPSRKHSPT